MYKAVYDCILYIYIYLYYNFQIRLSLTNMESGHDGVPFGEQEVVVFFGNNSVQFPYKMYQNFGNLLPPPQRVMPPSSLPYIRTVPLSPEVYSSTLKMELKISYETSVHNYQAMWSRITDACNLYIAKFNVFPSQEVDINCRLFIRSEMVYFIDRFDTDCSSVRCKRH
jgi:hypothetical protein